MQPSDKPAFMKILAGMAAIKPGKDLTTEAYELYWNAMQSWTFEDFKAAANHLAASSEFMPNPYHFDQLRKAGRPTAAEAWAKVLDAAGGAISGGYVQRSHSTGDAFLDRLVRAMGGWEPIVMCDADKLPFLERRFAEHFESLQDADDVRESVPQIAQTRETLTRIGGPKSVAALLAKVS